MTEDDGILTVTFDRQDKHNAIDPAMTAVLWDAAIQLGDRDDLRCLVITGRGPYFSAGIDIGAGFGDRPGNPETREKHSGWNFRRNYRSHHLLYDEFEAIEKPVVVAAQGHCLGAGLEMAVSCDFRFCTPEAEFGLPEVHLGLLAGSGGTSRLTRLIGPSWGKWVAMAGQHLTADQALQNGLVQAIYASDTFLENVYGFCRELMTIPAEVLGVAKLAVDIHADVSDRSAQRHIDRLLVTGLIETEEVRSRTRRFRQPVGPTQP